MLPPFSFSWIGLPSINLSWDVVLVVAAYLVFRAVLRASVADSETRSFWGNRVLMALAVGLLFSKIAPLFTRFQTVFEDPLLILSMNGGVPSTIGGIGMGLGILLVSWLQVKKLKPETRARGVWGSFGAGAFVFLTAHLVLLWVWTPGPIALTEAQKAAYQTLVPKLDGTVRSLSEFPGKTLVVNFWATWCPPCRAELPELQEAHDRKLANVEIVGVNLTSTEKQGIDKIRSFVERHKVTWPNLLDESNVLASAFEIVSVPTTIVFDAKGRIVERRVGPVDLSWLLSLDRSYGN